MDSVPSNEGEGNRPISELSTEEIERILQERKNSQIREKGEEFVSEREARRNMFLQDLGEGITTGESRSKKGEAVGTERLGIYKDGEYIGDIASDANMTGFTDREFQDKVYNLVAKSIGRKTGSERKAEKPRVDINIDADVRKLMNQMDMVMTGDKITLQRALRGELNELDLYSNGENKKIDLIKIDETKILLRITEKTGKVIEYTLDAGHFIPDSRRVKLGD